jgi:Tol biopolymer transport system component
MCAHGRHDGMRGGIMHRLTVPVLVVAAVVLSALGASLRPGVAAQDATPPPAPTPHPFAGETAWIAYQTYQTGDDDDGIGLIHPDGTDDHPIAADVREAQLLPDWSPDGTRLVFTTRGGETEPLYEYELATSTSRQLFACEDPCLGDDDPAYAPDGKRIAFIRYLAPFVTSEALGGEAPSDCGLWIGELSSGAVTQITSNTDPPCDREYIPRWSPDGSQLTYWRDPYANGHPTGTAVFVINADGSNERRLTNPAMFAGFSDWSPDGAWIVFDTYPLLEFQCCRVSNLYRMHPDGSGMEQLTHYATAELRATQPRYTPDGEWILFTAVTPSSRSLWAIPAAGGEPIVITPPGIYTHGAWQPVPAAT